MIGIDSSPYLKINRVIVSGFLGCDIKLGDGLNIIMGESLEGDATTSNNCGKTLFTDLIKYGLGARDKFSKGEIAEKIQTLALEVELNGNTFTIFRDLNSYTARLSIYKSRYKKNLELEEPAYQTEPKTNFSDFLLEELNIPNVRIPLSNKPGAIIKPITFQDFMRVFYMDQKNSFQEIMNKVQPDWLKTKLTQILLGMSKEEEEQLRLRIKELTDKIASKENEINNVTNFLKKSGEKNRLEIIEKRKEIYNTLNLIVSEINAVKQKMRGRHGITDELRESLHKLNEHIIELQDSRNKISAKLGDFQSLKNSLIIDREKLDKTREANFILSTIDFLQCPRCLQSITTEMREKENHSDCMLCGRPLVIKESDVRILDKRNFVNEEINETDILLERYRNDLAKLEEELSNLSTQKKTLQVELDNQSSSFVSPFVDELERLLHERNKLSAQIELLEQQLKQWQLLEELEIELTQYKTESKKLQAALSDVDTRDDNKIRKLSDYYESFPL